VAHAEASAKTVAAAVALAAAKLGLREDQVDVEVLNEPVPSTFGKIGEPALVRVTPRTVAATVADAGLGAGVGGATVLAADASVVGSPASAEATVAAPRASSGASGDRARSTSRYEEVDDPEAVAADTELAGDFIEGLLDVLDIDGDITTWIDEAGGHVDIEGDKLDFLIGTDGETLNALQELTRLAVLRQTQRWVRIAVDVDRYRARRRDELIASAKAIAERVAHTQQAEELHPMPAFERKLVHDVVAAIPQLRSESLGEEPNRRVLILPA
jgi:spoIIIJ-associated protein